MGSVDWIDLATDRNRWRSLMNIVTNLGGKFCGICSNPCAMKGSFPMLQSEGSCKLVAISATDPKCHIDYL